jgi:uncharacterized cupredoxin-like copper-binding protein
VKRRFVLFFSAALIAMLVVAACNGDNDNGVGNGDDYDIEMGEMYFDPDSISAGTGESVTLNFDNVGNVLHDFTIDDFNGERVHVEVQPGDSDSITLTMPDSAGEWEFYCTVPGHYEAGMHGTLTVN